MALKRPGGSSLPMEILLADVRSDIGMITTYGNPSASIVLIQMVDDHDLEGMESEVAEIKKRTDADFCLLTIKVQNWNRDLSPWPTPAVFGK